MINWALCEPYQIGNNVVVTFNMSSNRDHL